MIKLSFWLKKSSDDQANLEYITINNPKKILEGELVGIYSCEVYLPDTKVSLFSIYGGNPADALCFASEFARTHLKGLLSKGCVISEVEGCESWKLEKKDPMVNLEEKISELKSNKNISDEDKQKILGIMKESFGKIPHMKDKYNI